MKINRFRFAGLCGILVFVSILPGCAWQNAYSINMYYDAEHSVIPQYMICGEKTSGNAFSSAEFNDTRKINDKLILGQVIEDDGTRNFVFPKNIKATRSIPGGIKNYLKKAGCNVAEKIEQWDLREESIPLGDSKILIGGNIEELEISCRINFPTSACKSNIRLNVVFADMEKGRIVYKTTVESVYAQEHVLFSENVLGQQADMVLADAIERLFEDRTVAQKIKEAVNR